jgi:hypothetical protein
MLEKQSQCGKGGRTERCVEVPNLAQWVKEFGHHGSRTLCPLHTSDNVDEHGEGSNFGAQAASPEHVPRQVEDVCPTVVGTDGNLHVFPCCLCSTGVRTVCAPTKAMLRVAVRCVNPSSRRRTYAAQQSQMIVVPGGIHVLMTSNVLAERSGTGTRKVLSDSHLTPANTHVVLSSLPRLCWHLLKKFH